MRLKVHVLTRYADLGASSRVRFEQYRSRLAQDFDWQRQSLLDDDYLRRKYAGAPVFGAALRCYAQRLARLARAPRPDLWWVEKELWPYAPAAFERAVLGSAPYALDFDDAVFHNYDLHRSAWVRRLWGGKLDRLMRGSALVTAGNAYLAERAHAAGAPRVEIVPTVIDLDQYPTPAAPGDDTTLRVVWIGSPATVNYLQALAAPLARLAAARPMRLVVIGGGAPQLPGVEIEQVAWSAATEAAEIARCHIGVMPLRDSSWERGKCGYKLIQYMACGLPVVASPVGANREIVDAGVNGLLAEGDAQWLDALATLASDAALRLRLGTAGRAKVQAAYSAQAVAPRLATLLQRAAFPSWDHAG